MASTKGNIGIEGRKISRIESNKVLETYRKYKDRLGLDAIDSLLYGLVEQIEYEKGNRDNGRKK